MKKELNRHSLKRQIILYPSNSKTLSFWISIFLLVVQLTLVRFVHIKQAKPMDSSFMNCSIVLINSRVNRFPRTTTFWVGSVTAIHSIKSLQSSTEDALRNFTFSKVVKGVKKTIRNYSKFRIRTTCSLSNTFFAGTTIKMRHPP